MATHQVNISLCLSVYKIIMEKRYFSEKCSLFRIGAILRNNLVNAPVYQVQERAAVVL